jgi:hypothetical protein
MPPPTQTDRSAAPMALISCTNRHAGLSAQGNALGSPQASNSGKALSLAGKLIAACLEPAAALKVGHQDGDGYDLSSDAEPDERGPAGVAHEPAEVLPNKPVMKVSGKKIVAITASCFITPLSRLETVERKTSIELVTRSR